MIKGEREGGVRDDLRSQTTVTPAWSQISLSFEHRQREIKTSSQISSCSISSLTSVIVGEMVKLNKEIRFAQDPGPVDSYIIIDCVNLCAYFAPFFNLCIY